MAKGLIVYFDGPDGVGKTTQLELTHAALEKEGHKVHVSHTLGGTSIGDKLRDIILSDEERPVETDLHIALAIQYALAEDILIRRQQGEIVLVDRSPLSIIAYQVYGDGLNQDKGYAAVKALFNLIQPDLVLIYIAPEAEMIQRRQEANLRKGRDHFEKKPQDFHHRVISGYNQAIKDFGAHLIDAQSAPEHVFDDTLKRVHAALAKRA